MIRNESIIRRSDMIRCVLCDSAPCDSACDAFSPASALRSVWFANEQAAALRLPPQNPCISCNVACESACVRPGEVPIHALVQRLYSEVLAETETPMPADESRLASQFCGISLENPFLLSSSVVSSTYDMCARAFDAGWAGVSFKTISSLDIHEASPRYSALHGDGGGIMGFKNIEQLSDHSVEENMAIFRQLKQRYPHKFILASIMGRDEAEWGLLARRCQDNGADALELNFSCPNMAEDGLGSDIGQVPELVERLTAAARAGCDIPVIAKLTPNVANMSPSAEAAMRGGADGISAINTIKSVLGVNLHTYVAQPAVRGKSAVGGYSGNAVKPIALRFIAELGKNPKLGGLHLSAMGGIETWRDALEYIMLGAGTVQMTTSVMQYGYRIIEDLKSGLNLFMAEKGFNSIEEMRGISLDSHSDTADALERDSVLLPRFDRKRCVGCGRCALSCRDGGHQAIRMNDLRRPVLDAGRCVGCHLCRLVCPGQAIGVAGTRLRR